MELIIKSTVTDTLILVTKETDYFYCGYMIGACCKMGSRAFEDKTQGFRIVNKVQAEMYQLTTPYREGVKTNRISPPECRMRNETLNFLTPNS